ncbi:hypothetical protein ACFL6C_13620, partial [Myxococcota bacterium]
MLDAASLADKIRQLVIDAFEDGNIDQTETRMIIVGPSRHRDLLHLWAQTEWEDYAEPSEGDELADISVADWLDEVDALQKELHAAKPAASTRVEKRRGG